MSTPKPEESGEAESIRNLISAEVARRLSALQSTLGKGELPSEEDVGAIERLSRITALLPNRDNQRRRRLDALLLFVAVVILVFSLFVRLRSTAVDLDVRATGVTLTLDRNHFDLLIPGEAGEILSLAQVRISGADEVLPSSSDQGATLELRQIVSSKESPANRSSTDLAVRLQEIAIPRDIPFTLAVNLAYGAYSRGLVLHASGAKPASAQFGEVIAIGPRAPQIRYAIRPVRVSGKDLEMELFPVNTERALTVLREVHVSAITFESSGHSSILGGVAVVKSRPEASIKIQPSDSLLIRSAIPMVVRELAFAKGELKVTLSAASADTIQVGEGLLRDLRPTVFDWVRFRWPTQLYGAMSAIAALWFALRKWWSSPK